VIVVDFVACGGGGKDENAFVVLLEGRVTANSELVWNGCSSKCLHSCLPQRRSREVGENRGCVFVGLVALAYVQMESANVARDTNAFFFGGLKGGLALTKHDIAVANVTEFISGDKISLRISGPLTIATIATTHSTQLCFHISGHGRVRD